MKLTMVLAQWWIQDGQLEVNQNQFNQFCYQTCMQKQKSSPSSNVFMKVDIEGYECEAFIQSPKVLEDPALKAVVFEWQGEARSCPEKDFMKALGLLRKNGFQLLKFDRGSLKYNPK